MPFSLLPPVVKMSGHAGQALKISAMNTHSLPKDRESVFWLNVLMSLPSLKGVEIATYKWPFAIV